MRIPKVLPSHTDTLSHTETENSEIDEGAEEVGGVTQTKTVKKKVKLKRSHTEETKVPVYQP